MVPRLHLNLLRKRRSLLLGLVAASAIACTAIPADAALLDWLFPRRRAAQRQYYVLPAGTTPGTARYTTNYGSWGPSSTPYAWYAPQTQYRSLWTQVPVTTFRPVGTNGLQPCTSYTWQTQRVPVTAFQPVVGAVTTPAPAASSCGCANPATTAYYAATPTTGSCSSCAGGATTAYYGSTPAYSQLGASAWQTVAPATGNLTGYAPAPGWTSTTGAIAPGGVVTAGYAPVTTTPVTAGYAPVTTTPVTAGYAPDQEGGGTTANYAHATPWTPVDSTGPQTGGASEWQPYAGSGPVDPPSSSAGAEDTPWESMESGGEPTPADQSPTLKRPDYGNEPYRSPSDDVEQGSEGSRLKSQRPEVDDRLQYYDDTPDEEAGGSTTRTGHFRPRIPSSNERYLPFQRPIPDPDEDHNWDFDNKFRLRDGPQRSARRPGSRWEAIPVSATFTPEPSRLNTAGDRSRAPVTDLLPPVRPRRPTNEGGWRSLAR